METLNIFDVKLYENLCYEPELNNTIIGDKKGKFIEMKFKKFCDELIGDLINLYDLFNFVNYSNITLYDLYKKIDPSTYYLIKTRCPYYLDIIILMSRINNPNLNLDNTTNFELKTKFANINGIWRHCLAFGINKQYRTEIIYNHHPNGNLKIKVDKNIDNYSTKICDLAYKLNDKLCYKIQNNISIKYTKLTLEEIEEFNDETIDKMADVILYNLNG